MLHKDTIVPAISINLPNNRTYWNIAPPINITAIDPNFERLWYMVGSTTVELTNNTEELLNASIWSDLPQGEFQIHIFANDSVGNTNSIYILTLYKDTMMPVITIHSPGQNQVFNIIAPSFNITVVEDNLSATWYTIIGTGINYFIIELNGTINQTIWNSLTDGLITIRFYANDSSGNLASQDVSIMKNTQPPNGGDDDDDDDDGGDKNGEGTEAISFGLTYIFFTSIIVIIIITVKWNRKTISFTDRK